MDVEWIERWRGHRVFVLGDLMLDRFVYGRVDRISPEAPIPVLRFHHEKIMLGGAANVARNIVALGGEAVLVGVVGQDADGELITERLVQKEKMSGRFVRLEGHPTTVKTRYVAGGHQIMRLDVEAVVKLDTTAIDVIVTHFEAEIEGTTAVVLSDYAKGVLAPSLIARITSLAQARGIPVVVDPKTRDVARYRGATVMTPNAVEATMIVGVDCTSDAAAESAARSIRELAEVDSVVVTRGAQGMTIWDPSEAATPTHVPTVASEVFDVSGAGDTAVATLALALASGASVTTGARIANVAAGVVVGKPGTAVVRPRELAKALRSMTVGGNPKIVDWFEAVALAADWKAHGFKVGFTNGCFDLLHPGHVELLRKARATCDRLIVALNTDASVKRLKGESRPVQNERARAVVMASIESVDLVATFDEDTPLQLIELLMPDVLIKGGDYTIDTVVGADLVQAHGGCVILVPIEEGHSTTTLISRANQKAEA